ncbi:MAG: penicillin-binding protein 2 [Epsilonproteobacteria bacterium]|nr:penicillin-binding protein 2 [Campylobacterota bacterium]OIO14427.1 MAG: penicillin-binding protein 2 [Helicobacteraceae bacterium CG1_02_36_14]PIP09910.1 MAG: penicillin-binding protein 2 [Sulfurimonas sp. CG23_combo_of_CG06-09_8_20_14_all_36_33]PIS24734.1 MAG: penicillin-binding protein 2 [Sulfurimonas sp. CG08_land_8_20_14_0_20_36_33]PIU35953.1 MAG: penicillin-binding protein 2 [Sulfurimonas sp. CG07_land_8_20_14_0_80_36_56]PIV03011.1 MAG: penicillin-binding protein 2 [Sulfurimonas sp. C
MKIKFILAIFVSIWLALIVRVFFLSVESNNYYTKLSHNNTIKIDKIAPVRGEIVDRNNKPIAINKLGFKIQLKPHLRTKKYIAMFNEELDVLMKLLPQLSREELVKNYDKKDSYYFHDFIDIVEFISYEDIIPVYSMLNIRENINIIPAPKRFYPYSQIASHTIGYVSRANKKDIEDDKLLELIGYTGKTGIENYYNEFLQGESGERQIKVNANNQEIEELSYESAKEDRKLTLNIDIEFQKYISTLFADKVGAVVVMNVDGSILAASSFPEYDLNSFVSGVSHTVWNKLIGSLDKPFTNKLVNGLYPPGSTIKIGLGLIYITTELDASSSVNCTAVMPLGNRVFRCWKTDGHGKTEIRKAIRESCDDYFYKGSLKVGITKMSEGLTRYGLGKKTGVDLPNEFIGVVPSKEWKYQKFNKSWYTGETVNTSIGQGDFLVTPLQIAQFTALMATSKLPTPHLAHSIGETLYEPKAEDVLNEEELKKLPIIQKAMYEVCNYPSGTATNYLSSKVVIAGKTGTAQVVTIKQGIDKRILEHDMAYYNRSHAWFTSYGPYKNPQYVVLVMVEHGGHGGAAAGEIVSKIYNKLLELEYIKR